MIRTLSRQLKVLGAALALGVLPSVASAATVDLLILYDTYSRNYFSGDPQTAMNSWVSQMNAAYRDSQVDIQLRLVGVRAHEQAGADQGAVLNNLRLDSAAIALRDQLGADFVSQVHQTGACGVGYAAIDRAWTWNVVSPGCGPLTMVHELGHNMGLNHSRRQGNTTGVRYRYGVGHGVDNQFATIMAYPQAFNAPRTARFSNPNLRCGSAALPCGVPVGDPNEAYAALALQNVRDEIAAFRPTVGGSSSSGGSLNGTHTLAPGHSLNKRMDNSGARTNNGNPVVQWTANGTVAQSWNFSSTNVVPAGNYNISNRAGPYCLDLTGTGNNSRAVINGCNGSAGQSWRAELLSNGRYLLRPASAPGRCLYVPNGSQTDGTQLIIYDCNSAATDGHWQIQ